VYKPDGNKDQTSGAIDNVVEICKNLENQMSSPKVLACPSDGGVTKQTRFADLVAGNISYFIGLNADESKPQTLLSGDRNIRKGGSGLAAGGTLTFDSPSGGNTDADWGNTIHVSQGNIGLADGSSQQATLQGLRKQIDASVLSGITNVIIKGP
jgi:hypothetical protein